MRVNFVLPTLNPSGGVRCVKEYTQWLNDRGHDCRIYYPAIEKFKHLLSYHYKGKYWYPYLTTRQIRPADVTIATAWETAKIVLDTPLSTGKKAYFIQHYEALWDKRAKETYNYPLYQIVLSHWLYDQLHTRHGTNPYISGVGIHLPTVVYKEHQINPITILMPWRNETWKGTDDGLAALEMVHDIHPECKYQVFGWSIPDEVPPWIEVYRGLTAAEVSELYYNADIVLVPSHCEGTGIVPLEAMARMCAVVTTDVGEASTFTNKGQYGYLTMPKDIAEMVKGLKKFIEDDKFRVATQHLAFLASKNYSFEKAANGFEQCLISLVQS